MSGKVLIHNTSISQFYEGQIYIGTDMNKNLCTNTFQIQEVTGYCAHQFKFRSRVILSETVAHFNQLALYLYWWQLLVI